MNNQNVDLENDYNILFEVSVSCYLKSHME